MLVPGLRVEAQGSNMQEEPKKPEGFYTLQGHSANSEPMFFNRPETYRNKVVGGILVQPHE